MFIRMVLWMKDIYMLGSSLRTSGSQSPPLSHISVIVHFGPSLHGFVFGYLSKDLMWLVNTLYSSFLDISLMWDLNCYPTILSSNQGTHPLRVSSHIGSHTGFLPTSMRSTCPVCGLWYHCWVPIHQLVGPKFTFPSMLIWYCPFWIESARFCLWAFPNASY